MSSNIESRYIASNRRTGKVITPGLLKKDVVTDLGCIRVALAEFGSEEAGINNPFPVADVDSMGRVASNSIFGDRIVGVKKPSLSYQYNYGYRERDFSVTEVSTGSVSSSESLIYLKTGTAADGKAVAESKGYLRYIPGHEAYSLFTVVFTQGAVDSHQRAGIYDDNDGFFIGYEGDQFSITRRRAGVDETKAVDTEAVFAGFDPTKGNVYKISFGYLGFANIFFEVLTPAGQWVRIGSFDYPNSAVVSHITNTHLPIRGEVVNTGNTTDIVIASASVSAGIVDGGDADPVARPYTYNRGTVVTAAGNNLVVLFRNVTTYKGKLNRIKAVAELISAATEGNKPFTWQFVFNPTVTNAPTWLPTDPDSIIEYSTNATITFGTGAVGVVWSMAKADSFFEIVSSLNGAINAGDTAAIVVNSSSAGEVEFSMRWKELF